MNLFYSQESNPESFHVHDIYSCIGIENPEYDHCIMFDHDMVWHSDVLPHYSGTNMNEARLPNFGLSNIANEARLPNLGLLNIANEARLSNLSSNIANEARLSNLSSNIANEAIHHDDLSQNPSSSIDPDFISREPYSMQYYTHYYTNVEDAHHANIPDGSNIGGFPDILYSDRKWETLLHFLQWIITDNHAMHNFPHVRGKLRFGFNIIDGIMTVCCLYNTNIERILNSKSMEKPANDYLLWFFEVNLQTNRFSSLQFTDTDYIGDKEYIERTFQNIKESMSF